MSRIERVVGWNGFCFDLKACEQEIGLKNITFGVCGDKLLNCARLVADRK